MFLISFFKGEKHEHYEATRSIIEYVSKTTQYEYSVATKNLNVTSAAIVYLSFTILEKLVKKTWINKDFMQKLVSFMKVKETTLLSQAKDLLTLMQNFESRHQGLNNMKSVQFKFLSKYI